MLFYLDESVVDAAETNKEVYNKLKELYYTSVRDNELYLKAL